MKKEITMPKIKTLSEAGRYFEKIFGQRQNEDYKIKALIAKRRKERLEKNKQDWGL